TIAGFRDPVEDRSDDRSKLIGIGLAVANEGRDRLAGVKRSIAAAATQRVDREPLGRELGVERPAMRGRCDDDRRAVIVQGGDQERRDRREQLLIPTVEADDVIRHAWLIVDRGAVHIEESSVWISGMSAALF